MALESGIPIVLIPGLLNTEDLWRDQMQGLADLGNVLVTTEQRDYDNMPEIADRILNATPERFALAGLSLGGYVAFEILRQAPERVITLALLDTTARPDTEDKMQQRRNAIQLAREQGLHSVLKANLPNLLHPKHLKDKTIVERLTRMAEEVGVDAFVRQQNAIMNRPDSRSLLPDIRCPTLVLCGREDSLTPPELAQEMADTIPNSRLVIIKESGHLSAIEQPEQVTASMREWLTTM
ncbi:MAG TPA: alpha/beta hydrolase [Gammaproteobacteria bacterium]|jgi:pimeloyl-ACP methyl ester carboxylesterase|nr:alpha/beta hydrolase [Gammaproteobacteria bacterium]